MTDYTWRRLVIAVVVLGVGGMALSVLRMPFNTPSAMPAPGKRTAQAFVRQDLSSYYPGLGLRGDYLQGQNSVTSPPSPSVLWFERQDRYTFLQYNSRPGSAQSRCNADQLSWWPDGYLRYVKTTNACGSHPNVIDFSGAPIVFLPRTWDGNPWQLSGSSPAVYSVDGVVRCTGTTAWMAQILGVEEISPGELALHWRTTQSTRWATGDVQGGCFAGTTLRWQEDYWFTRQLPGPRSGPGHRLGLKRARGGNLDVATGQWDIWMNRWASLP